jgi:hypothetical protein
MAKKFQITDIVLVNGNIYAASAAPAHFGENATPVKNITLNRPDNAYNKGFQVPGASYTVAFDPDETGVEMRRVIPFDKVADVGIAIIKEDAKPGVPELPED